MKPILLPLRALALAAALASTGAIGQTVAVSASDVVGVSGSTTFVDIQFSFSGDYRLLAADLLVGFDPSLLAWDQAATTLSVPGLTDAIDNIVASVNGDLVAIATLSSTADSFSLAVTPFNPPLLNSVLTLHAAFTVLPSLGIGASTDVLISGNLTHEDFANGVETAYATTARVRLPACPRFSRGPGHPSNSPYCRTPFAAACPLPPPWTFPARGSPCCARYGGGKCPANIARLHTCPSIAFQPQSPSNRTRSSPLIVTVFAFPSLPSNSPLAAWESPCCACSDGGKCPASTTRLPACPCCTHRPGLASTHPHGRHLSISRFTHTPYHRRTPSLLSPSPFQAASYSSPSPLRDPGLQTVRETDGI